MTSSMKKLQEDTEGNSLLAESTTEVTAHEIQEDCQQTGPEVLVEPSIKLMPTLPQSFNSLVGFPINITNENRKPQNIIILLGDALGVNDYQTNIASFWFLDFIALQVLCFEAALDNYERSMMVSWLAGAMKLIRDKKMSHEAFLREMKDIFVKNSEKIMHGHPLLHWDLMTADNNREEIIVEEEIAEEPQEQEVSRPKVTKNHVNAKLHHKRNSSVDRRKMKKKLEMTKIDESEMINIEENITKPESRPKKILDIFMKAMYNMYGDSFHYALIVAAFTKPIQLHEYILPFTFREPRPLKMFDIEKHLGNIIKEKTQDSLRPRKSKEIKKKYDKMTKKKQDASTMDVIQKPVTPVKLTEEEILMKKREFILPLMEANEASIILENYGERQAK